MERCMDKECSPTSTGTSTKDNGIGIAPVASAPIPKYLEMAMREIGKTTYTTERANRFGVTATNTQGISVLERRRD